MRLPPCLLAVFAVSFLSIAQADSTHNTTAGLFRDGDRWAVVGDSVTQNGYYHTWVATYYATRFPDRAIDIFNCGISGDSAAGALRRYDWDIAPKKPTVATIMMGMNDVSRGLYAALPEGHTEPSPEIAKKRADALAAYQKNMTQLIARLQADGARVQLLTPSIYDETMRSDGSAANLPGVNSLALAACAQFARGTAAAGNGRIGLIEIHQPMTALNAKLQQADPTFTLVGPDRVHPRQAGHFVMAYYFLKSQGAPSEVSHVAIDISGTGPRAAEARNATVSDLARSATGTEDRRSAGLTFTVQASSLPCPVEKNAAPALDWIPFTDDLNRETLIVTGLAPGSHTLAIDNQTIRTWTAAELSAGVNLATEANTPQAKQAAEVLELIMQWRALVAHADRGVAQVEHWQLKDTPHPVGFDDVRPRLEALVEKWHGSNQSMDNYNRGIVQRYLKVKPDELANQRRIRDLVTRIREAARPRPHAYALTPAPASKPSI